MVASVARWTTGLKKKDMASASPTRHPKPKSEEQQRGFGACVRACGVDGSWISSKKAAGQDQFKKAGEEDAGAGGDVSDCGSDVVVARTVV